MTAEFNIDGHITPSNRMGAARMSETRSTNLVRLEDMDDFEVASGDPDPRGWVVKASDGQTVGTVKHLLVDPQAMRVALLEVELDGPHGTGDAQKSIRAYVPVESARLREDADEVLVDLSAAAIELLQAATMDAAAALGDGADDLRFFGGRRAGRDNAEYLVRRERRY